MQTRYLIPAGGLFVLAALSLSIMSVVAKPPHKPTRYKAKQTTVPNAIVKQILNHPKLQQFLHPEAPGRIPVIISAHLINPQLSLRKFGKPVRIVPDSQLKGDAVAFLRFDNYSLKQDVAIVGIRYKVEGVGGYFKFRRSNNGTWKLIKTEVWEN